MTNSSMKADPTEEITSAALHAEEEALCLEPDKNNAAVDRTSNALETMSVEAGEKTRINAVETKTVTTNALDRMTSNAPVNIGEDMTIEIFQVKREQQEEQKVHVIDLRLPGGRLEKGINPLEAAKLWIKHYYPNLNSQSLSFISDYEMPMPMLDENTLDNLISKKESKNKDDGDAKYLKDMKVRMTGIENEMKVTDMFLRFLNMAKPMVVITQFQWKSFSNLFSPASGMDQEIDDVSILGEYSGTA